MRLLFISEYYLDVTNANASCMRIVAESLCSNGIYVDVVCDTVGMISRSLTDATNPTIYPVKMENRQRVLMDGTIRRATYLKKRTISLLSKSLVIPMFPLQNVKSAKVLFMQALMLAKRNKYDAVVIAHKTIESVYAGIWLKNKTGLPIILYELDPLINEIDMHLGLSQVLYPIAKAKEVSIYNKFDLIAHMECHKKRFEMAKYRSLKEKQIFLDFPLYEPIDDKEAYISVNTSKPVRFICLGTLDSTYRPPFKVIDVLELLRKEQELAIDFYTKGDCEMRLKELESKKNSFIHACGYVPTDVLNRRISEADILIDIGNKYSDMVPSKLFHMFSYRKPIIHFSLQADDAAVPYLERYPCAIIIPFDVSMDESIERIKSFIHRLSSEGIIIRGKELNQAYYSNTPSYTVQEIEAHIMDIKRCAVTKRKM